MSSPQGLMSQLAEHLSAQTLLIEAQGEHIQHLDDTVRAQQIELGRHAIERAAEEERQTQAWAERLHAVGYFRLLRRNHLLAIRRLRRVQQERLTILFELNRERQSLRDAENELYTDTDSLRIAHRTIMRLRHMLSGRNAQLEWHRTAQSLMENELDNVLNLHSELVRHLSARR